MSVLHFLRRSGASRLSWSRPLTAAGPQSQAAPGEARPTVFMHIPKTSGTALNASLQAALKPSTIVGGFDHCLFGAFSHFESIEPALRKQIYDSPSSLPRDADYVSGHFALSTLLEAYPQARRLTMLREPTSRLISHWLFWRQHSDADLAEWGSWIDTVRLSRRPLAAFLAEPQVACQTDNMAVRQLLWPHTLIPADGFIDPKHDKALLRAALASLRAFDFIDVVENGALTQRLERWLNCALAHHSGNETMATPAQWRTPLHRELTPEAYRLLDLRSRLDLQLWLRVAERCLPDCNVVRLREQTRLTNVARYGALTVPAPA